MEPKKGSKSISVGSLKQDIDRAGRTTGAFATIQPTRDMAERQSDYMFPWSAVSLSMTFEEPYPRSIDSIYSNLRITKKAWKATRSRIFVPTSNIRRILLLRVLILGFRCASTTKQAEKCNDTTFRS